MTVPKAKFQKTDGQTGALAPSGLGMLVIIAPAQSGAQNELDTFGSADAIFQDKGDGPATQIGAYVINVAGNQVAVIRPTPSVAASYGGMVVAGGGTSAPSAGATAPLDDWPVVIKFVDPGNVTVAGITYQVSLDGGDTFGPVLALGTANAIAIPNTGITVNLTNGTILAGETVTFSVKGPRMNNTDLATALEALRISQIAWEGVLVVNLDADHNTVSTLDLFLEELEDRGLFKFFACNTRRKNAGETEGAFLTAMTTLVQAGMQSIRGIVGTDGCALLAVGGSKSLRGISTPRDAAVVVAARAMKIDIAEDPAFIGRGALDGAEINDAKGKPFYHDEQTYPGLDDIRLTTLRNVDGEVGTFVNNARVISEPGSDYVYLQHVRVMNRACEIGWQRLKKRLSQGVRKDPATGFMLPVDRKSIELDVNETIKKELKGRVSAVLFTLSEDDNLSSNEGATVTGELELDALAYIKGFLINAHFSRTLKVAA